MYHYLGNERLQFGFFSPNVCAAFLVVTVLLTIGLFLLAVKRKGAWPKVGAGALGLAILIQLIMIAVTYSRGGYLACFAALAAAAVFCRKRWSWVFPALFLIILLLTGGGASRVKSMGDVGEGSIRNRLLLWHYGTGVIAEHWRAGTPEPGEHYTRYYQPLWLNESYYSLINDYLTIAAKYGIFVLFGVLTVLFFLLQYGFRLYLATRNELLLYALAALTGYIIAGCFTTCYRFLSIQILLGMLLLILAGFLIRGIIKKQFRRNRYDFWPPPLVAALFSVGVLIYGAVVCASRPWQENSGEVAGREVTVLAPRRTSQATVIIPASEMKKIFRAKLRPLAEAGFSAVALPLEPGLTELPLLRQNLPLLMLHGEEPHYLLGFGEERAMQAIALADSSDLAGVIAVEPPVDWPFEELSPREQLRKAGIPVHIFLREERAEDAKTFRQLAEQYGIEVSVTVLPETELKDAPTVISKIKNGK